MISVFEVRTTTRLRFESLRQEEAITFAQRLFSDTRIVAEVFEVRREPVDFRSAA